ncbi:hypothetical protein DUZ99_11810 [Xylanibacillus composti]|uniref:FeS cluster biogenesis domain-containing protein n=1 Tax=Xylanibacillus composti TaxID=1572762 RepID=A0A8J4GZ02_9BACL|nr:hypothetical protein [Xylanibacillus composti]MDT9725659.1 hypothetical protein [Xylanibacillus composti]GIQ67754.1 hypothetical protein XYCOK13_05780 [Xylanibacillus composti]
MNLHVTPEAALFYKEEMDLQEGDHLCLYVKLYGSSSAHPNFSIGVTKGDCGESSLSTTVEGITFYLDAQDQWYVAGYDLRVSLQDGEISFQLLEA